MGMLMSKPKYTPPPEMAQSERALAEREATAAAKEKKELRALASRSKARRMSNRMLLSENGLLGVDPDAPAVTQEFLRDPMQTNKRY